MSEQLTPKNKMSSFLISQSSYNLRSSPSRSRFKKKKITQVTLFKRGLYRVYDNAGVERTPKLLHDPDYQALEEWQPTVLDYVDADSASSMSQISIARGFPQTSSLSYGSRQQHQSVSLHMSFTNIANVDSYKETTKTLDGDIVSETRSDERISEAAPSAFRLRDLPSREFYPPHSKVPLIAKETNSFTLFSMNSVVKSLADDDINSVLADNEFYEFITVGKGKYKRKLNASEQQTPANIATSEVSYCPRVATKNSSCWVTTWKLFDEYSGYTDEKRAENNIVSDLFSHMSCYAVLSFFFFRKLRQLLQLLASSAPMMVDNKSSAKLSEEEERRPGVTAQRRRKKICQSTTLKVSLQNVVSPQILKNIQGISTEDQWVLLAEDERFMCQGIIMDRVLGSSAFTEIQLTYKMPPILDPMAPDIRISYSAKKLWVYNSPQAKNKPVVAIAVNKLFPNIIAVGYGKFLYTDTDKGFIGIWCAKNPIHPERFYKFSTSVTCLDFATWTPNLLAAGFLNGDLLILDVSSLEKKILYSKDSIACDSYDCIIFTKWWICSNIFGKEDERLMITAGDGRIIQFRRKLDSLVPFQMMRITKTEGKVKGIDCLQRCEAEEISMVRFPAARSVVRYPNDHQFYLVSGDDGTIHKCSTNFFTQHVESFLAHSGPVYALKFSPFCNKIFLTCGADGVVRLWVWDIFEPVITLTLGPDPVEDAAWSPRNSTVIASITESYLYLWDLRRKIHYPASTIAHPDKLKFCSLQFTEAGDNIILGDIEGSVYVMGLYGMPFEEKFKEDVLAASIEKELVVKPKLLKLVKKSGHPFS